MIIYYRLRSGNFTMSDAQTGKGYGSNSRYGEEAMKPERIEELRKICEEQERGETTRLLSSREVAECLDFIDVLQRTCKNQADHMYNLATRLQESAKYALKREAERDQLKVEIEALQQESNCYPTTIEETRAQLQEAKNLLRRYNEWAGTSELDAKRRAELVHATSVFLATSTFLDIY